MWRKLSISANQLKEKHQLALMKEEISESRNEEMAE